MRFKTVLGAAVCALVLAGCANVQKKAFNKEAASHVNRVAVTERAGKESYMVNIVAHPGMNFGLIGGLVAAADLSSKSDRLTSTLDPEKTALQKLVAHKLADHLKAQGYETSVIPLAEGVEGKQAFSTMRSSLQEDALLALDLRAGYVAAGPDSEYLPYVEVAVLHTDVKSGETLYQDTISYGYGFGHAKTIHLTSDPKYRFKNMDDLAARAELVREGLHAGVELIASQIAADLKR